MRPIRAILMAAALAACDPAPAPSPAPAAPPASAGTETPAEAPAPAGPEAPAEVDGITLERTRCFGSCPAYRLTVARDGAVRFQSLNPGDSTAATDRIAPASFDSLVREAERIGFRSLPDVIGDDRALCDPMATDHPTATVTIRTSAGTKRVEDYHGCHGESERLAALRRFESRIDSVAGSARWVRPATRR